MLRSRGTIAVSCVASLGAASSASAHPMPGVSDFYAGVLHPLLSMESALAVAALGLLIGTQAGRADASIGGALFGVIAGALLTMAVGQGIPAVWLGVPVVALGILLAWSPALPDLLLVSLAAATGMVVGLVNGGEMGTDVEPARFVLGTAVACVVATSCCGGVARGLRYRWAQTGMRVLGGWLVAIGVVMLSLAMFRESNVLR